MTATPTIAVVGSGPIGSTYARLLLEALPDARVIMFEAGPQVTPRPGESVRNLTDPDEKARAREMSQGPQAGQYRDALGILAGAVVEGMFTARQGTHLLDFGGEGSAHASAFPAAAAATNVGGQGAHWTCAIPRPAFSEKLDFIADDEWEDLISTAEDLLHKQSAAFSDSPVGAAIRTLLDREFAAELPEGYGVSTLPVAGDPQPDGTMRWAGADTVLGPLIEPGTDTAARFELRDLTLVRRIEHDGAHVRGVVVEDLRTREESFVEADAVVVAADAFRSPQLLWASGIRPAPLGRYLTEHHVVISTVALDAERMSALVSDAELETELARRATNPADPVAAVNRIPFSEPDHPYSAQIMYAETPPFPLPSTTPRPATGGGTSTWASGRANSPVSRTARPSATTSSTTAACRTSRSSTPSPSARTPRSPRPPRVCAGPGRPSARSSPSRGCCRTARACTSWARCGREPTPRPPSPTRSRACGASTTSSSAATPSSPRRTR